MAIRKGKSVTLINVYMTHVRNFKNTFIMFANSFILVLLITAFIFEKFIVIYFSNKFFKVCSIV